MKFIRTRTGRTLRLVVYIVLVTAVFFTLLEGVSRYLLKRNTVNPLEIWPMNPVFLIWDRIAENPAVLDQLGAPYSVLRNLIVDKTKNTLKVEEGNYYLRHQSVSLVSQHVVKRILFLGGSSVYGQSLPPEETIPNLVKKALNDKLSENTVEVFNVGVPGANSTFCKKAMEQISGKWKPDIVVIYSGHNDYLPFSAMYSPDLVPDKPPWNWVHYLLRRVSFLHLFAGVFHMEGAQHEMVVREFSRRFQIPGKEKWKQWEDAATQIDRRYEQNLMDITRQAKQGGAEVIIASITSNLLAPPPVSIHGPEFTSGDNEAFDKLLSLAEAAIQSEDSDEALSLLDRLIEMDDHYAKIHFLKGKILFQMDKPGPALESLRNARDIMTIRAGCTNAPTSLAESARRVAQQESVALIDVEHELWAHIKLPSDHDLLFSDCLHFTSEGTAAVAGLISERIFQEGWIR